MSSIYNKSYRESLLLVNSHNDYLKEMLKVEDKLWWSRATKKNTQKAYENYLSEYINGTHALEAKQKVDEFIAIEKEKELEEKRLAEIERRKERLAELKREKECWNTACQQDIKKAYESYLSDYLNGIYRLEAKEKIDEFITIEKEKELERKRLAEIARKEEVKLVESEQKLRMKKFEKKMLLDDLFLFSYLGLSLFATIYNLGFIYGIILILGNFFLIVIMVETGLFHYDNTVIASIVLLGAIITDFLILDNLLSQIIFGIATIIFLYSTFIFKFP